MSQSFTIAIVGNPNSGKTTLFNALTGSRQQVGNWSGVTVEKKTGFYIHDQHHVSVIDLPGTYSLESDNDAISIDEKIARDYVASRQADLIINVIDASSIERNLYLTSQLIEMRIPMLLVLNMMDSVKKQGIQIDIKALSQQLKCPVVAISAANRKGIPDLLNQINAAYITLPTPSQTINYHSEIEKAVAILLIKTHDAALTHHCDSRWLSLRLLENDSLAIEWINSGLYAEVTQLQQSIKQLACEDIDILAADARYSWVNQLVKYCVTKPALTQTTSHTIDRIVLNRYLGLPIFLFVMYCMFLFTISFGTAFVDFFDQAVGALLVDGAAIALKQLAFPELIVMLLTQGLGGGIQVVSTFIPIVGFLFVFLAILEDSGYMARAAFVVDRVMCFIGLPGKSFVPMIIGFGCNVPAIIATRTLDNQRDRILTNMMNPFMSCGARLPVYALFAAAFFPENGQSVVFTLYLSGILAAIITGLVLRITLLKGSPSPFIMELPPYRWPTVQAVGIKSWQRLKGFIINAGKLIVPMVLILNIANNMGFDGSFERANKEGSILSIISQTLTPIFEPMGIETSNWPATVGIFTGMLAKEAVVGTLNTLYSQLSDNTLLLSNQSFDLNTSLRNAWQTIPDNLVALSNSWLDPLGLDLGDLSDGAAAAERQQVKHETYIAMQRYFQNTASAFAYLLFILLYAPCVAATAAIYRETHAGWALFIVCWTTGLAYITASTYYQIATIEQHPTASLNWITGCLFVLISSFLTLRWIGNRWNKAEK